MAITFPLARADFANRLDVASFRWSLERFVEMSGTAIGQVITNEIATPRWKAEVMLVRMTHAEAADIQATLEAIGPSGTFYLWNPAQPGPALDLDGDTLGSSTVTIHTVGGNNKSLRLTGLPSGYVISRGDMLHFDYGSDPTRRALHRAAETETASGAGLTPSFEVRPYLRAGTVTGLEVTLIKASAKMMLLPGSIDPGVEGPIHTTGMAFTAIEVR